MEKSSWAHEICAEDNEERAIVIASMNEMAYVLQAWLPLIVWQQVDAPQYQKGFITVSVLSVLLIVAAFVTRYLFKRQILRYSPNLPLMAYDRQLARMLTFFAVANERPLWWRRLALLLPRCLPLKNIASL